METWKSITGYERYQISSFGRVKSLEKQDKCPNGGEFVRREMIMKLSTSNGYKRVGLLKNGKYKHFFVHRLVAQEFIPNPLGKIYVNHIDSVRDNNRVENLEWCTQKENVIHSHKMGRHPKRLGKDHPNSTLTKEQAIEIKKLISEGLMPTPISKIIGVNVGIIYNIKAGKSWKYV